MTSAPAPKVPSYCRHRGKNRAFVRIQGDTIYLGRYGSAASRAEYDRVIKEWLAGGRILPPRQDDFPATYGVVDLAADYLEYALGYYVKDGAMTDEVTCLKSVIKILVELFGDVPADDFGPKSLVAVQQYLLTKRCWTRGFINASVWRIKRVFRWGVANEKIRGETWHRLDAVRSLAKGRSGARDNPPTEPAPQNIVDAVRTVVSRQVRAIIDLQLLTGARPGEICAMRGCDLRDMDKPVWRYVPEHHKTEGHGHIRQIAIGPRAQAIIRPFLQPGTPAAYLFSPAAAERERRQLAHELRRTPASCGNGPGSNRVKQPEKQPGDRYDTRAYAHAVRVACEKLFPLPAELRGNRNKPVSEDTMKRRREWRRSHAFHPHQLRHTFATMLRADYSLDAAQVILGHAHAQTTEIYAAKNYRAAEEVIGSVG